MCELWPGVSETCRWTAPYNPKPDSQQRRKGRTGKRWDLQALIEANEHSHMSPLDRSKLCLVLVCFGLLTSARRLDVVIMGWCRVCLDWRHNNLCHTNTTANYIRQRHSTEGSGGGGGEACASAWDIEAQGWVSSGKEEEREASWIDDLDGPWWHIAIQVIWDGTSVILISIV